MAVICRQVLHLCRVRATRLLDTGEPAPGPNNVYVTDKPINLGFSPVVIEGEEKDLAGGCDCTIASYRGRDKLKRFDLDFMIGSLEPAFEEMLLGAPVITDPDVPANIIGVWYQSQMSCSAEASPLVALEAWQTLWDEDEPSASPYRYARYLWPASQWQLGETTLENEFRTPAFVGRSRVNSLWGDGIYGDQPEDVGSNLAGYWFTDTLPEASCEYQSELLT